MHQVPEQVQVVQMSLNHVSSACTIAPVSVVHVTQ
jgi:hypothetical protein